MRRALAPDVGRRPAVSTAAQKRAPDFRLEAPIAGWVSNQAMSRPRPQSAFVLDNFFPLRIGARVRGGCALYSTISSSPVESLFTYASGGAEKLFAADAAKIYDVSSGSPVDQVTGLTGGAWTFIPFGSVGTDVLIGVNGADAPRIFDGSTWSTTTFTGTNLTQSSLSHVWSFKQRLFFIERGTMSFWYPSVDAIAGAMTEYSLAGVFQGGGSLLFGSTWSIAAGDGPADRCIFVTTTGEVAVFQGSNPSDASDWSLVGVYKLPAPMGKNAIVRAAGDVLVATVEGVIPLSAATTRDPEQLRLVAISEQIEPDWVSEAAERGTVAWDMIRWDDGNMGVVATPAPDSGSDAQCFVVNMETGAWARYTGWDAHALAVFNKSLFFGDGAGRIYQAEVGGSDNGALYTCAYAGPFLEFGPGFNGGALIRPRFRHGSDFIVRPSLSGNYAISFPTPPSSPDEAAGGQWDAALWDSAVWDKGSLLKAHAEWRSVNGVGFALAPQLQMTFGVNFKPDALFEGLEIITGQGRLA